MIKNKTAPWFKKLAFNRALENPAAWLSTAYDLKWSADRLCWLDENHQQINDGYKNERSLAIPVYRMIVGLSFENIIKGIIVAQGERITENGKLKSSFSTHNIQVLLPQITSNFQLSNKERQILLGLQEYVLWQGRYPIPKEENIFSLSVHGTDDHRIEQDLWERMTEHLSDIGWFINPKGEKVAFSSLKNKEKA